MNSGNKIAGLQVASQARVNAFNASLASLRQASTADTSTNAQGVYPPPLMDQPGHAVLAAGANADPWTNSLPSSDSA